MKINKNDLIEEVAVKRHLTKKEAKAIIDKTFDLIVEHLKQEDEVMISGLGTFTPVTKEKRVGTNPKTHKQITIKEKKTIRFSVSNSLKDELNEDE